MTEISDKLVLTTWLLPDARASGSVLVGSHSQIFVQPLVDLLIMASSSSKKTFTGGKRKNVIMTSHGRAPWYGLDGKNIEAYVIGIAGGSASGKTSVARSILSALNNIPTVLILSQDAFYRHHSQEEIDSAFKNDLDLDHPDAIDTALFAKCLRSLKQGKATEIPVYSFVHHQRMPEKKYLYGASVIIVEGIMALESQEMRNLYDLKVFVNCDSDLMLARRIKRDIAERGRDVDGVLDQYLRFVKNSYDNFVQPSSKFADVIVPGSSNQLAIELLVTHVKRQLESRTLRFRNMLAKMGERDEQARSPVNIKGDEVVDEGVILLEQTNQLKGIMTILRDQNTERGDFIFYADRLSTIIVEKALTLLPYKSHTVTTPVGKTYDGVASSDEEVVGISILRSGGPLTHGLRRVIRDVAVGAMLIQSDPKTGEPLLLSNNLPHCIKNQETSATCKVLLLDSQMGTGAAALMAIRVLLDHGVAESNIIFLTYLIARRGLFSIRRTFPAVQIVTAAIDPGLHEMHIPMSALSAIGEGLGDADFGVRIVEEGDGDEEDNEEENEDEDGEERFAVKVPNGTEELKFNRKKRRDSFTPREKRAWVVEPGMGHIGDRYYIA
ncbi:uridine kinase, partial [Tremellales sp. Uapishka_1]